ncbi:NADH-quinone oxidoreductase subunit NuoG [Micavibrio aeruginosavorus]|uniref:NADH-quinone oxidoreductase n=1 Tax=Micavibrio aeruginosavorus (strain ARL-13) TaxID=856793 RepID=G2KLY9_MICAA|nr:NADH-quinone oxidoreductase subunit NuoG [Micavibrio aeruginosavorus]AEP09685.1 NADH dehydrogenase (quinone), G subunit [Micavibrio aeruginosavorus ARL-13]
MPKLKINDIEVEVEKGTSILQAAEMLGIEIPRFCYHDRLTVPANCRMCLVEVKGGPPKPQASCALACADNMEVFTETDMVKKARKGVMEMLLINHPLDCPICDQGGECDLQDQAVGYGYDRSRYYESKRAVKDKDFGPLIKTVMTRCIQCTRCVRFGEEIGGVPELGLLNRGEDVEITTFVQAAVSTELSGNMIDVCPVGALTSKPYAFQARPWELKKTETIDVMDAVGANIRVDSRGTEVMRVLPRLHEDVNEEWIDDRTRFAYDGLKRQRLDRPFVRDENTGRLRAAEWDEAFAILAHRMRSTNPSAVAALAGDLCDLESMVALKDLMGVIGSRNLECRTDGAAFDPTVRAGYVFNTGITGIEQADAILLVGTNPRAEAAMINARIRKAWRKTKVKVGVIGENHDLSYPTTYLGAGADTLKDIAAGKGAFADVLKNAKNPMIIVGMGAFRRADGLAVHALCREVAETFNMVRDDWNGFNVLHVAASRVGALDIGFVAGKNLLDVSGMELVYLLGCDDAAVVDSIPQSAFVVYQGHHGDAGAARADIILPGAAYTEKDGLYVNTEGRVQMGRAAVWPVGEAREDWKVIRALSAWMDHPLPYDDLAGLRSRIVHEWPHLGQVDTLVASPWRSFGASGLVNSGAFVPAVKNFYITNVVTKASLTMAKCATTFARNGFAAEQQIAAE